MNAPQSSAAGDLEHGRRIQILDTILANQIAAGEVVERPASVLKELMENALDAGATRVDVQVERGGAARIRVRDNGCGMHRDDLYLALARHATSKIATLAELEALQSMGFRGEALPSIASVSRLRLESRLAGADTAWSIQVEGGAPQGRPLPSAQTQGTTVEVRDLFFNTPARRRFLRTERTEIRHLEQVFRRLALARMDVAMSLEHNSRQLLGLPRAGDERGRAARLARVLGAAFARDAMPVFHQAGSLSLHGWLGGCEAARERPDLQHLYVNNRAVSDTMVRHAVRLAYGDRLHAGQHPAWVLFLQMDPRQVDVNVHPSKQEVRFHEARMVHDFLRQAAARALGVQPPATIPSSPGISRPGREVNEANVNERAAMGPVRSIVDGSASGQDEHRGLALLGGRMLLCQRGQRLLLAEGSALLREHVRWRLRTISEGAPAAARPLLLPERFDADAGACAALSSGRAALRELGLGLRQGDGGSWILLEIPACLAPLPVSAVCAALCGAAAKPEQPETWIALLAGAAEEVPLVDLAQGVALMEVLARGLADAAPRPWRELDAGQLQALLEDDAGP